ncbi:enoyl-CoA hydratase/isomerase family protein [Bordetella petrii]|nr:enoyl-CoA hydratase/isomerase family protein [Bordetella petrii]
MRDIAKRELPMTAVILERHDGWAELVLNRPERKNAIDGTLARSLHAALADLESDGSIRAVVLRGAGGAFCSGLDVKAFGAQPQPEWKAGFPELWDAVHTRMLGSRKVWVVALERYAINGGAALALAGDLLVCGGTAFLQVGEIAIGMAAPRNAAWLALRHSEAVAARVCLLGERIGAAELLRLGIASEVVDDETVLERARELACKIAAFPATSVAEVKSGMRAATMQMPAEHWLRACAQADPVRRPQAAMNVPVESPSRKGVHFK